MQKELKMNLQNHSNWKQCIYYKEEIKMKCVFNVKKNFGFIENTFFLFAIAVLQLFEYCYTILSTF